MTPADQRCLKRIEDCPKYKAGNIATFGLVMWIFGVGGQVLPGIECFADIE